MPLPPNNTLRKPPWIKSRIPGGEAFKELLSVKKKYNLTTVCEEARCPNHAACWEKKHATFMILGDKCTRNCLFCSVIKTSDKLSYDQGEALRVAEAVFELGIRYCVITSVTRDDLDDGGADQFAETILEIRKKSPGSIIELLIPDLKAHKPSISKVVSALPNVLGHNLETSRRMHKLVRPKSDYDTSLKVLKLIKKINPSIKTKSAILAGLGESDSEIHEMLRDLKEAGTDIVCIGQYLKPSPKSAEVDRYVAPEKFRMYEEYGLSIGLKRISAGPLIRSSYPDFQTFK